MDSDATITIAVALIVAVPPTLVAAAGWYTARGNRAAANDARAAALLAADKAAKAEALAEESRTEVVRTRDGVYEVGKRLDGRLEALLKATEQAALAKGTAAGIAQERADPQSPRESERRLDSGPIEVVGVADPGAEPIRTVPVKPKVRP